MMNILNDDLKFTGKAAEIMRKLAKTGGSQNVGGLNLFETNFTTFAVATAIGISRNETKEFTVKDSDNLATKILSGQMVQNSKIVEQLYITAMLTYKGNELSEEERITRAFRVPYLDTHSEEEKRLQKECVNILLSYTYAGLDVLNNYFEDINPNNSDAEELTNLAAVRMLFEIMNLTEEQIEELQPYMENI